MVGRGIIDYLDEILDDDEVTSHTALGDQSAFITSLSGARTGRMRDMLSATQADQDAITRADFSGALVVAAEPARARRSWPCTGRRT